ncbi:uncharacterized protein LOC134285445 [Aedes albopictus]|uniref:Integrase zinc-binding domain-containing protein n=1 Tax=Aedes albopictus TaxID=7160 RepID=A0ABM1ZBY1_AEDAL
MVDLNIAGIRKDAKAYWIGGARTVSELQLPHQTLEMADMTQKYPHLQGLPVDSYFDARPRILIRLKHARIGLVQQSREGNHEDPIAIKTRLGWAVYGGCSNPATLNMVHYTFHICEDGPQSDESLHNAVKEFFDLESIGISKANSLISKEDSRAIALLQSRTKFENGRYETGLLWKFDDVRLPNNREMALRRYYCLQKRLQHDQQLSEALNKQIASYLEKGYLRKLPSEELAMSFPRVWYLPTFPVTNPNKPGKTRLVWDAAAKAFGVSLNSVLVKGPDQLSSLFTIHIQFRQFRVGLTGDLKEMFHQVNMRRVDQQCQRIFWPDVDGELSIYVLCVMTFGACCSPSCAQYVKNINADRFIDKYPAAVETIQKRHYVDDMLESVEAEDEAIALAQDVKLIHAAGGFEIRNWLSNFQRVMAALKENSTADKDMDLNNELATEKILGMWWRTSTDSFTYKIGWNRFSSGLLSGELIPTKRQILRVLMSIFDSLGLISHFLIYLKIILQDIWRSKIGWDDKIDGELHERWRTWLDALPMVETVSIPRCFRTQTTLSHDLVIQMHTLVDASENALAAAVYLRFSQGNVIECSLVAAKTRVASLKLVSIPRLELQAALIGARLAKTITNSLSIPIKRHFYWTDSRNVMCWIKADHRRYSQFVGFRISEISELTASDEWHWVQSKENVADMGTKWKSAPDLSATSRWFQGPAFLWEPEDLWIRPAIGCDGETEEELRPSLHVHYTAPEPVVNVERFSTWKRLHRVVAYVHRFFKNCQLRHRQQSKVTGPLKMDELRRAEQYLIRQAQQDAYADEIAILRKLDYQSMSLPKTSALHKLTPWLDADGLLRMRGRISSCEYARDDAKNPIIMPRHHHTTRLIIIDYHLKFHHKNHETVVNELRQKYRIPRIRSAYFTVRKSCQKCKNDSSTPRPPIMAELPIARLAAFSRPFTFTGIDYFGPIEVATGRRREKRWGMLATCLTIRAIHIEIVSSLTTDSCVMAIRNFMARRGVPRAFYSDRGTNFVGANRTLN